jgi:uncharacterized membrane protein
MILAPQSGPAARGLLIVAALILVLFFGLRRNPKDRVLWCQALAFISFVAAVVIMRWADLSDSEVFLTLIPFIAFTFLAGYFALMNRLRRRKKAS